MHGACMRKTYIFLLLTILILPSVGLSRSVAETFDFLSSHSFIHSLIQYSCAPAVQPTVIGRWTPPNFNSFQRFVSRVGSEALKPNWNKTVWLKQSIIFYLVWFSFVSVVSAALDRYFLQCLFYSPAVWGEIRHFGEWLLQVWGLCPQRGSGAEPLVRWSGWEAPQKVGVWGLGPQRGPGAEPLVRWSGGKAPRSWELFAA